MYSNFTIIAKIESYERYSVAYVDPELTRYYLSLVPKYFCANSQAYPAHVTIIRPFEKPNGYIHTAKNCIIEYNNEIQFDGIYFYLNCWSKEISEIRIKSGLQEYRFNDCFHITIGNVK